MSRFSRSHIDRDDVYRQRGWVDANGELTQAGEIEAEERYMERRGAGGLREGTEDGGDHGYDPGDNFNW